MPNYDYICKECGHTAEIFQPISEDPLNICPNCHLPSFKRRIGAGAGLLFKGSGFYITDYKHRGSSNGTPAATESRSGGSSAATSTSDTTPSSTSPSSDPA